MLIGPGAKRQTNKWPKERFSEIAKRWTNLGGFVIIIGAANDKADGEQLKAVNKEKIENLAGETTLIETLCLMKNCTVALTNDSGPMHMASAVELPLVVAFSARDFPVLWFPNGSENNVIRKMVECSPCLAEDCKNNNICLETITVDEVWEKVKLHYK